jgi:hypothetical protein
VRCSGATCRAWGDVATRSALLNQDVLPKEHLEHFLDLRARYDALGVVAAHSGTCLGLLFDPRSLRHPDVLPELVDELLAHDCGGVRVYRTFGALGAGTTTERIEGAAW